MNLLDDGACVVGLGFCPPTLVASITTKKVHMLAEVAGMKLAK